MKSLSKYFIQGFIIAFVILLMMILIELTSNDITISLSTVIDLFKNSSGLKFIAFSPFFLGFILSIYAFFSNSKITAVQKKLLKEQTKSENIHNQINEINNGNLDTEFSLDSDDDGTNKTEELIISLQENLKKNKELEAKVKIENEQRSWTNIGLAKFGELLRENTTSLEDLAKNIITNLVKYINANQGGFFILDDEDENDKHFQLLASLAYDRQKFNKKRIDFGEGLIGTCGLETESIFLTDVPNGYVDITSGLGDANPRCIFITPLKVNEELCGILEFASFKVLEQFEIDFLEKIAESIAATIINMKTNIRTSELLKQSQEQSEILSQNEEEMRQNMEKLSETQEQVLKQGEEFEQFTNAVNHTMIRAEYNIDGSISYANSKFLEKLGYQNNEIENKKVDFFIDKLDKEWFNSMWEKLADGGTHYEGDIKHVKKDNSDLWMASTYVCKRNQSGQAESVLFLATDITDKKEENLDFKGQLAAINISNIKAEISTDGIITNINNVFLENLNSSKENVINKKMLTFLSDATRTFISEKWNSILTGESYKGTFEILTPDGTTKWHQGIISTVNDSYGKAYKLIYIANDITDQKLMEIESVKQSEQLKIQEELLTKSQENLSIKLEETKNEMKAQFKEIETIKIKNELTLEGLLDAVFSIDDKGKIDFFNKAAEDLWGYTKDDVLNKNVEILFSKEIIETYDYIAHLVDNEKEKYCGMREEVMIKTKDGEDMSVLLLISEAEVNKHKTYTVFVQNIEVELF